MLPVTTMPATWHLLLLLGVSTTVSCWVSSNLSLPAAGQFRAAVYEHELVVPYTCTQKLCTREQAIQMMEVNLAVLRRQVEQASTQGANIILLPEDGIHGYGFNRHTLRPFLEHVPTVADGSNPCYEDSLSDDAYVQTQLSCMAAENNIYVAADMGSVVAGCEECGDEHGKECFFNTLVIFDNTGALVAVYHKYNLWTSELPTFDIDPLPQLVTVDTAFGRLGLSICADMMWKSPIVDLVELGEIDTLLLPLSWWDLFPHQLAVSNEDAWARGLQVNLLAANTHNAEGWSSGSGIFTPSGHVAYYHDLSQGSGGKLLVADLDIKPVKREINWSEFAGDNADNFEASSGVFSEIVYDDLYNFVPLTSDMTNAKVCTDDMTFCCIAEYEASFSSSIFSLGVFSGDHYKDGSVIGHWRMQMCTVIKCDPQHSGQTCAQDTSWDYDFLSRSDTVFNKLRLAGTFGNMTGVYPEVLFDSVSLVPALVSVSADGVLSLAEDAEMQPLVSMSLFGRVYHQDPDSPEHFCPA
eukprot:GFUD01009056.1.p1 GENE.GFUD01009056.1~~GFUD01009056.1.p1  ORF type:complete len:524 (-),score=153.49 GFUD01009056.1:111-1682(-)